MRNILGFISIALAIGFALPSVAYTPPGPIPQWQILKDKSNIQWSVNYSGHAIQGVFPEISGTIQFDEKRIYGSRLSIKVPTGKVRSNDKDAQDYLPTHDWLGADDYPNATFSSKTLTPVSTGHYTLAGDLTIHGRHTETTFPITIAVKADPDTRAAFAVGESDFTLKRLDFAVGSGEWSDTSALGNDVKVHVHIEARRMQ